LTVYIGEPFHPQEKNSWYRVTQTVLFLLELYRFEPRLSLYKRNFTKILLSGESIAWFLASQRRLEDISNFRRHYKMGYQSNFHECVFASVLFLWS